MSNAKKKSFILFNDLKGTIDDLDDAEAANLLRAIFEYQQEGNVDSFDKLTKLLMKPIILQFKRDAEKWEARSQRSRENGAKSKGRPRNPVGYSETQSNPEHPRKPDSVTVSVSDTVSVTEKKVKASKRRPNSQEEVVDYCKHLGLPESDGTYMFDHWEGNGYKNSGKAMNCWKATIRSWKTAGYLPSQKNTQINGRTNGTGNKGVNRNHGTCNEGKGHLYAGATGGRDSRGMLPGI